MELQDIKLIAQREWAEKNAQRTINRVAKEFELLNKPVGKVRFSNAIEGREFEKLCDLRDKPCAHIADLDWMIARSYLDLHAALIRL